MTTETRVVLFTDVVGSTAQASRLTPDAADDLRRRHFSGLRRAVAECGGMEVKNLGDGLMVVFSSASSALSCGVAMQQAVEQDNHVGTEPIGLRVGISAGEVTTEDNDYFGDPVIEASRLCARCERGQILAANVVRLMAGRRSQHRWASVGALALAGLPEPLETVEVGWDPLTGEDAPLIPLPNRLAIRPDFGIVGRVAEMTAAQDVLKRVTAGEGREVVLVSGEPGQGKTTIVAEVARSAVPTGSCVLAGYCERDLTVPYRLFREALHHYVVHASEERLRAHVADHGSELVHLVPALASRIPDLPATKATDSDSERYLVFAAVVGLLAVASEAPTRRLDR